MEAAAVQAATDTADSLQEMPMRDWEQVAAACTAIETVAMRQRAFIESVRRYNEEVAAYALPLASQGMSTANLAAMLIKAPIGVTESPRSAVAVPSTFEAGPNGSPTTFNQPLGGGPASAPVSAAGNAPMTGTPSAMPRQNEPTLAPPRERPFRANPYREQPQGSSAPPFEPAAMPPSNSTMPPTTTSPTTTPPAEAGSATGGSPAYQARRESAVQLGGIERVGLYSAMTDLSPARRAQELAGLLNWDRGGIENMGRATSLVEALSSLPENRAAVLAAYWDARRQAARYLAAQQAIEELDSLAPTILEQRGDSAGPLDMLRLRDAKLTAQAAMLQTQVDLIAAQWTLARRMQRPLDDAWPMPTTAPHGGGYRIEAPGTLATQARQGLERPRRTIPEGHTALQERGTSLVLADATRAIAESRYEARSGTLSDVLSAVDRQSRETDAFLNDLTQYNVEIGQYVLAMLPPQASAASLADAMVLKSEER
jgi:hypothetical protein